jgi:hypothetical protein
MVKNADQVIVSSRHNSEAELINFIISLYGRSPLKQGSFLHPYIMG